MQDDTPHLGGAFRLDNAQVRARAQRKVVPESARSKPPTSLVAGGAPRGGASRLVRVVTIPKTRDG